ncbi:MAG: multidrug transporter permease, partial [Alphaproteobacteria bacterium]|nr:multidrug transporter permease [Alphaproteobacteria bacterium]
MAVEADAGEAGSIESGNGRRSRVSPRTRLILLALLAVVVVLGTLWYLRYSSYGRYQQSTNDAYVQSDSTIVAPKVGGYVERVFVIDNQRVKRGDPLLSIDSRDYRAQAQQAQAQIGVAEAGAAGIRAQIREQQAEISQARAQLAFAENGVRFTRSEVARYTPLAATGAETGERLASLRSQQHQAESQAAGARAALAAAERRIGTLQAQIGQALSQRRAAEAQLAAADVNLGSTMVRAATAGRIGNKNVEPGQFVQPGLRMMTIVPTERLYVEANYKETQLALLRVGQPATISVDALEGIALHGRVESVSPGTGAQFSLLPPQNATGNFTKIVQRVPVRISIDAGPRTRSLLVPGMSVEVSVDTRS